MKVWTLIDSYWTYVRKVKIWKGYSEVVKRRRTDNATVKGKMTRGQAMSYKTLHRQQDWVTRTLLITGASEGFTVPAPLGTPVM